MGYGIQLSKMQGLEDCLEILSNTSKRRGLTDGKVPLSEAKLRLQLLTRSLDPDARDLAIELDGLPLALATAGAYLEQTSISFRSYLRLYKESWAKLQTTSPVLSSYEDRTLYSTWQLSLDQIERQNKHSAALLRLWAYFHNQDLWLELLQSYNGPDTNGSDTEWIREITKDEPSFTNAIRTLSNYGFVEVDYSVDDPVGSRGYSMHSCVHSWSTHVLSQEWNIDLARFVIQCITSCIPEKGTHRAWVTGRRLLQHAEKYTVEILDTVINDNAASTYHNLGNLYGVYDRREEAVELLRRSV